MLSVRLQGFIPQKLAHFEKHILTLHTVRRQGERINMFINMNIRVKAVGQAKGSGERCKLQERGRYRARQIDHNCK
jgi:hypothetical protein